MNTHPNLLSAQNSLLVVIDVQTKLTAAMSEAEQMLANASALLEAANRLSIPVIVTEQYPQGLGATESAISTKLLENTPILPKTGFSCCAAEGFNAALQASGRKQIIIIGQEAHVCVLQTALELLFISYQVHIVEDAVCSRIPAHKFYALNRLRQQGATISNYESVLFEWLRDAAHPEFKAISQLLR